MPINITLDQLQVQAKQHDNFCDVPTTFQRMLRDAAITLHDEARCLEFVERLNDYVRDSPAEVLLIAKATGELRVTFSEGTWTNEEQEDVKSPACLCNELFMLVIYEDDIEHPAYALLPNSVASQSACIERLTIEMQHHYVRLSTLYDSKADAMADHDHIHLLFHSLWEPYAVESYAEHQRKITHILVVDDI